MRLLAEAVQSGMPGKEQKNILCAAPVRNGNGLLRSMSSTRGKGQLLSSRDGSGVYFSRLPSIPPCARQVTTSNNWITEGSPFGRWETVGFSLAPNQTCSEIGTRQVGVSLRCHSMSR